MPDGGTAAAGWFTGSATVAGTTLAGLGNADIPLLRFDAAGTLQWSRVLGGASWEYAESLTSTPDGGLVLAGRFQGPASFGGSTLTPHGSQDGALAAYDAAGAFRWQRQLGAGYRGSMAAVAADASRVVATGYTMPTAFDALDLFVATYGLDGTPQRFTIIPNDGNASGLGIALGADGATAVVGMFSNTIDFGGGPMTSLNAQTDGFVAVLEPTGMHRWSRQVGAPDGSEQLESVTFAGNDVAVCGTVVKPVDVGTGLLPALGSSDALVIVYGPGGAPMWARRFGGINNDYCKAIAYDAATGEVVVAGSFDGTMGGLGGPLLVSAGSSDVFVIRMAAANGAVTSARRFGGTGADVAWEVTPQTVGGYFFGAGGAWPGGSVTSRGGADGFVARP